MNGFLPFIFWHQAKEELLPLGLGFSLCSLLVAKMLTHSACWSVRAGQRPLNTHAHSTLPQNFFMVSQLKNLSLAGQALQDPAISIPSN